MVKAVLNPRYTLKTFVFGKPYRRIQMVAEAIANNPGTEYNPCVICGGIGLGKTHLLHAIGNEMRHQHPKVRMLNTTGERFARERIRAVQGKKLDAFRARYRPIGCLLIDDIQFLVGKGSGDHELSRIVHELIAARKQIIIASDRSPREMPPLDRQLISRLEAGFVAKITPPDVETRIAILRKKIDCERLAIPNDVVLFVAAMVKTNVRVLEGALIRLEAYRSVGQVPLTVSLACDILKDMING